MEEQEQIMKDQIKCAVKAMQIVREELIPEIAKSMKALYDGFIGEGFSHDDAMTLLVKSGESLMPKASQ